MINAILEYVKQRSVSTFLVSFTVFWAIQHWDGIYMTLFTSQELIYQTEDGLLKNEYAKEFFGMDWGSIESWWENIIFPTLLALFYVLVFPLALNLIYKVEARYRMDRNIIWDNEERRFESIKRESLKEKSKSMDAQIELSKKRAEAASVDPEIKWSEDFDRFISDGQNGLGVLTALKNTVYVNGGYVYDGSNNRFISEDSLMTADVNGLIKFDSTNMSHFVLTEKGKYFLKEYAFRVEIESI